MKKYNIDLILKYEECNVVEKLNSLLLNTDILNISEEEKVEYLIKYIETKIKEQDK